jgi:hypothetical protein
MGRRHLTARQRRRREVAPPPGPWRLGIDGSSSSVDPAPPGIIDADLGTSLDAPPLADGDSSATSHG